MISPKSNLAGPEPENKLKGPSEPLKHRFYDLNQFAFWDGQEEENDFKETWEP